MLVSRRAICVLLLLTFGLSQLTVEKLNGQQSQRDSLLGSIQADISPKQKVQSILKFTDQYNDNSELIWELLDEALQISTEEEDVSNQIKILSSMGFTSISAGDYTKAQAKYHEAALLANETGDSLELYWANYSLALVNYYSGNYAKSEEIYLSLENYIVNQNDTLSIAGLYNNLGMIYNKTERYNLALKYYNQAYLLKKKVNSPDLLNSLNNLADTYFRLDSFEKSEELFREFYTLAYETESVMYQTVADLSLGSVILKEGQAVKALEYLNSALKKSRQYFFKDFEHVILNDIATAYAQLGKFEQAYEHHKLSRVLADSLNSLELQRNLNEQEKRFDTKLKETQIENLKIQESKNQRLILFQRLIILFSVVALIIIGFLLFVQFRQNNTIATQRNELVSLNQNKDRFFSIIAHDLRSPFNSILGLLDLLSEEDNMMSREEFDGHLRTLEKTANTTFSLLQNLLNWARSQMNNLPVHIKNIPVHEVIHEQCRFLSAQANEKNILLDTKEVNHMTLLADYDMLSFIVRNVIGNALKFTHPTKSIIVRTYAKEGQGYIEIEDQGVGISKEKIRTLFEIGASISSVGTNGEKGSGLGLPLCKSFTEKMGGDFQMISEAGHGTKVQISLKLPS